MNEAELPSAAPPARRWHQYSLRTLLLLPVALALVLSAIYTWPIVQRRYIVWRLRDYVDKDFRFVAMAERQQIEGWLAVLLGEQRAWYADLTHRPEWLLHSVDTEGGRELYVFELNSPGTDDQRQRYSCLDKFDSRGRLVRSTRFNTGIVGWSSVASCDDSRGFLCLVVEREEHPMLITKRQYYRVTDEHVELLRTETLDGKYSMARSIRADETPHDWSDWQRLLESPERLQQLRGLAAFFSNGRWKEQIDDKIRHRLSELAHSPDPWVSEEAKLALEEAKKK